MKLINLYSLIPMAPLLASVFIGLFGRKLPKQLSHIIPIFGVFVSLLISLYALYISVNGYVFNENLFRWITVGQYDLKIGFLIDNLSAIMMVVVSFVSLMVHIYTIGYMRDDSGYSRFFSFISLFTFAMLMLVMSNNFLQLFFGWEAVGLVSYLLIGFWYQKPTAIHANMKAFLVNRVGDFGFLLGISLILFWFGTLDYYEVFSRINSLSNQNVVLFNQSLSLMTLISILLFIGAMGKSAQIPLHVWLPDSMEGPTPISALIHAATMVTAGIFMISRMSPIIELSDTALSFILIIGSLTALTMGILGIFQNDIKKVVAYSTLSQLGYMTIALGVSSYSLAIFHLFTHAFFKALLFLGAGSVIIGMHHDQDIRNMGNIKKYMPITWITFLIGTLALVGMPFFSGFFSKESIIDAVKLSNHFGSNFAYFCSVAGVFITSLYSFRLYLLVFHGKENWKKNNTSKSIAHHGLKSNQNPHESDWVVTVPLILLAIPSVIIGYLLINQVITTDLINKTVFIASGHDAFLNLADHFHGALSMSIHGFLTLPFWLMVAGFFTAYFIFYKKYIRLTAPKFINTIINARYGFDTLNEKVLAPLVLFFGNILWKFFDIKIIDNILVNGTARLINIFSQTTKKIQTGYVSQYAFFMVLGLLGFASFFIIGWIK
jgi:NADH-quinone oxidoreductase subunit L